MHLPEFMITPIMSSFLNVTAFARSNVDSLEYLFHICRGTVQCATDASIAFTIAVESLFGPSSFLQFPRVRSHFARVLAPLEHGGAALHSH